MKTFMKIFIPIILFICFSCILKGIMAILLICCSIIIISFFTGAIETINNDNNGKNGYYAEYGESYGANANKHKKYLEEKIANNVMK